MTEEESPEEVGSLAEETARFIDAFSTWARDQGSEARDGVADLAAHASEAFDNNFATGSPECSWCPVCRGVHIAKQLNPEVRAHLTSAATSLLAAAAGMLATLTPDESDTDGRDGGSSGSSGGRARGRDVEHIDVDQDPWPDDQ